MMDRAVSLLLSPTFICSPPSHSPPFFPPARRYSGINGGVGPVHKRSWLLQSARALLCNHVRNSSKLATQGHKDNNNEENLSVQKGMFGGPAATVKGQPRARAHTHTQSRPCPRSRSRTHPCEPAATLSPATAVPRPARGPPAALWPPARLPRAGLRSL